MSNTSQTSAAGVAGKVALVTGGSRGIGRAIAHALTAAGANVVITGRDQAALDAAAQVPAASGKIQIARVDVQQPEDAARAVDTAVTTFGGLDVLINNAGVGVFANVADMSVADWQRTLDTNLSGVFYCCHAAIPHLRSRGGGWIINISSLAGRNPFAGGAAYCASKAGLNAFAEALMLEVRYDNIRVSTIMPGSVDTDFGHSSSKNADWKIGPDDVAQTVVDLLEYPARSLPSRIELRPTRPPKK